MTRTPVLMLCLLLLGVSQIATAEQYLGSAACGNCHQQAYDHWQGSHHDLAMQAPTDETVLGNFDGASFTYNGITTRFSRQGDAFIVTTDGPDGKLTDFPVAWVFGVYPLQQYLLPLSDGRLQALSIAWDSRPDSEGGQRWYHLYPEEKIDHRDPLHWTGPYQNWNARCAECHSTDVEKGYDAALDRYETTWREEDVGCESCHGPGEQHLKLVQTGRAGSAANAGFPVNLSQRGSWRFEDGAAIATRSSPLESNAQIDTCGRCHARRGTLGDYHHGTPLLDTHRLSMLTPPLYWDDGQIRDEVYVYGSFVQSRMHQAGVVCSNCHEPHSQALRAPGNGVCAQCHQPAVYDTADHHFHPPESAGAQCANCHMPETVYMGVDARRDHSMRIPRPDLSVMTGAPNACTGCHDDRSARWALDALSEHGVQLRGGSTHPARSLQRLRDGDLRAVPAVTAFASDPDQPGIWRATAIESLASASTREAGQVVAAALASADPMLRASAVRALQGLPPGQRYSLLAPLIADPILTVRLEVALALADIPLAQLDEEQRAALASLFSEYQEIQQRHADMPSALLQTGVFLARRGDLDGAGARYRRALELNPQLPGAWINLADLQRMQQREEDAAATLASGLEQLPNNPDLLHAAGLAAVRRGDREAGLEQLALAAQADNATPWHRYVYAIGLADSDRPAAIRELESLARAHRADPQMLLALVSFLADAGERERALGYVRAVLEIDPEHPQARQWLARLGRG